MLLIQAIKKNRLIINQFLHQQLTAQVPMYLKSSPRFARDGLKKIIAFTSSGKGIRGGLYYSLYQRLGGKDNNSSLTIAAAIELIQSGLLIHDDIIDNDYLRRNQPTIFAQYQQLTSVPSKIWLGKSLAICLGDICYFLAFKLINQARFAQLVKNKITTVVGDEIIKVGFGQMEDVFYGQSLTDPNLDQITNIYRFKTARYTFYLPISLAIITTGFNQLSINNFEPYAEAAGMIFQITDDLINLFSSESISGKSLYSDLTDNKKTLIRYFILKQADQADRKKLIKIFGSPTVSKKMLAEFKQLYKKYQIAAIINKLLEDYRQQAITAVNGLHLSRSLKNDLVSLVDYLIARRR